MHLQTIENFKSIELHPQDFERYLPVFNASTDIALLERARSYLDQCNRQIKNLHDATYHSAHLMGIRTRMIDDLVLFLYREAEREAIEKSRHMGPLVTLVAQGGYGRQEMNIHSDIDLLFLFPKKKGAYIELLTEKMLYVLWDLGFEVGNATRTVSECARLFVEDSTCMTALLDVRYLCGDIKGYEELVHTNRLLLKSSSLQKKLVQKKMDERKNRIQKFGGSVFVLEPNIKECAGGLRDLQFPSWIAKIQGLPSTYEDLLKNGLITEEENHTLGLAQNFFWRMRNELHFMVGRKVDLLTFGRQEAMAPKMGFAESNGILAVEKFMQTYYKLAYGVLTITDTLLRRMVKGKVGFSRWFQRLKVKNLDESFLLLEEQIAVSRPNLFRDEPLKMMELFKWVQEKGYPIHPETKDHVRASVTLVTDEFRKDPRAIQLFREMLNNYWNLGTTLTAMHETHFLDEWLPEFKKLRCRVQHDSYHIYTIDTHSIFAVNELSKLWASEYVDRFEPYREALAQILKPELLTLGLFLHDIGKGEGGNHSVRGAEIASQLTQRLGYSEEEQKTVEFLVISHLMMPHLSQRRDLEDPELIIKFARSMGTMDNLNMLFLLTWGDIRAVGPEAWTDWKGTLLLKLYEKTRDVILKGEFSKEKTKERIARVRQTLTEKITDPETRGRFQKFLSIMPPRYYFAFDDQDIERHYQLLIKRSHDEVIVSCQGVPGQNLNEVLIYTLNTPSVFSQITGGMLAFSMNIIRADIVQTTDGHVLIMVWITDAKGNAVADLNHFDPMTSNLKMVLSGELKVEDLIVKKQVPDFLAKTPIQKAQTKVVIDNDVSAYSTVIDIYAHDRLGLLYDLTRILHEQGCYVEVSKISTKVEQVTDVFYVKDIFGHKITAPEKIKTIKSALMKVIEGDTGLSP